jgi:glycosyltransferase involved in cell wall biosynthesis
VLAKAGVHVTIAAQSFGVSDTWKADLADAGVEVVTTPFPHTNTIRLLSMTRQGYALGKFHLRLRRDYDTLIGISHGGFHRHLVPFVKDGGFSIYNLVTAAAGLSGKVLGAFEAMDGILTLTSVTARALASNYGVKKPIAALPHLIGEIEQADVADVRRPMTGETEVRIAYFGRLNWFKRPYILLRIWESLRIGPARLDFYGDGYYAEEMQRFIDEHGLSAKIRLNGRYAPKDVPRLMAETDLVVLPSRSEGLGLVLVEALAHGVPFVATRVGGVPDLAEENPNVMLAEPDDQSIALAVEGMVARLRKNEISAKALQAYFVRRFSYGLLAEKWLHAMCEPRDFFGLA